MKNTTILGAALLVAALAAADVAAQASPAAAPAPGSAGIFRANADLMRALAADMAGAAAGEMTSSSITVTDQYRGSLVRRSVPNGAIAHQGNTEMHYIVEGSGTVITGGTIVRSENAAARIEGGESHRVTKGDIIIIPAGSAHMYSQIDEPITYLEWRWVAPS
jgi:mannose-6-phosphate isomerase-like protein (cupin superfamily)